MPEATTTTVLVIDHNAILREGISFLIRSESDMLLLGSASNLRDGLALIARSHADCILVDLDLPSTGGIDVVRRIREIDKTATVIGLVTYELDDRVSAALAGGASAVLSKDQISTSLFGLIRGLVSSSGD